MIAWKPKSLDPNVASVRYRCLIPLLELQGRGFPVTLYQEHEEERYDTVIFSKLYDAAHQQLACRLKRRRVKIILDICDNHFYNPTDLPAYIQARSDLLAMIDLADQVVCSTEALANVVLKEAALSESPAVIGDPVEPPNVQSLSTGRNSWWKKLNFLGAPRKATGTVPRLVWFGIAKTPNAPCGMQDLLAIQKPLETAYQTRPFELVIVSNDRKLYGRYISPLPFPTSYVEWNQDALSDILHEATAVVIPIDPNPFTRCKSNNRIAMALHAGVPVVADEIPSYTEFAPFCYLNSWGKGLHTVLTDRALARQMAQKGSAYIQSRFLPRHIADRWARLLGLLEDGNKDSKSI